MAIVPEQAGEHSLVTIATPDNIEPFEENEALAFVHLSWEEFQKTLQETGASAESLPDLKRHNDYNPQHDGVIFIMPFDEEDMSSNPNHADMLSSVFQTGEAQASRVICFNAGYIYKFEGRESSVFSNSDTVIDKNHKRIINLPDHQRQGLATSTAVILRKIYRSKDWQFSAAKHIVPTGKD